MLDAYVAGVNAFHRFRLRHCRWNTGCSGHAAALGSLAPDRGDAAARPADGLGLVQAVARGGAAAYRRRARDEAALRGWRHRPAVHPAGRRGGALDGDVAALAPAIAALLDRAAPDAAGGGSNNWALSAERSATGRPFLAGDPHRVFEIPNMYAQGHLACDAFDVIGLTVPGVPGFPHFAHNGQRRLVRDPRLRRYPRSVRRALRWTVRRITLFRDAWLPVTRRRETIAIRGAASREIEVVETAHGPIVAGDPVSGTAIALRSVQFAETDLSFDCLPRMLQAANVPSLFDATRGWGLIDHNLVAGDTQGQSVTWCARWCRSARAATAGCRCPAGPANTSGMAGFRSSACRNRSTRPSGVIVTANNRVIADGGDGLPLHRLPPANPRATHPGVARWRRRTDAEAQSARDPWRHALGQCAVAARPNCRPVHRRRRSGGAAPAAAGLGRSDAGRQRRGQRLHRASPGADAHPGGPQRAGRPGWRSVARRAAGRRAAEPVLVDLAGAAARR